MPTIIDAVSMLHTILNTAEEIKSVVKKTRKINENTAKEIHSYVTELVELLNALIDYKVIPETLINFWKKDFDGYRRELFGYASESAGITIAQYHGDELTPYPILRENMLDSLNDLIERISNAINYINKQVESGKIDIYSESSQVSIELENINSFINFYNDAKAWLNEHSGELYYYTSVTLSDVIHNINNLSKLIDDLRVYVTDTLEFARKFELYDLIDNINWIKNMFDMIADAPNIAKFAIDESDESTFETYEEIFIDSLMYIDDFLTNFESILDTMYKRVTSK